jgi:hypothetical protein
MPNSSRKDESARLLEPPSYERSILAPLSLESSKVDLQTKPSYQRYFANVAAFLLAGILCFTVFNIESTGLAATFIPSHLSGTLQSLKRSLSASNASVSVESDVINGGVESCPAWFSSLLQDFKPWRVSGAV